VTLNLEENYVPCKNLVNERELTKISTQVESTVPHGSIARSASRRYLNYSEADFEVFRPSVATRCIDGGEIWRGGGNGPLLTAKFHPHRCNDKGVGPQKLKFLLRFDQNVEYKRPTVAYHLRDFYKICRISTSLQVALLVKISLDLLKALLSYGGFKLRGSGYP